MVNALVNGNTEDLLAAFCLMCMLSFCQGRLEISSLIVIDSRGYTHTHIYGKKSRSTNPNIP